MQRRCARSTAIVVITVVAQLFASRSHAGSGAAEDEATAAPTTEPASSTPDVLDVPIVITVDTKLGEQDEFVGPQLRAGVRERLTARGFHEERTAPRELTIVVRWSERAAKDAPEIYAIDYQFATLADAGKRRTLLSVECERCGLSDLLDAVERDVGKLRPELAAPVEVPEAEPPPPVVSSAPAGRDDRSNGRRAPLSSLGKAGIGVTASGVAVLVAGAVLLATPTTERVQPDNPLFLEVTSYRKPAIAALSIGVAVLVAGVVMLAVDRARARRSDATRFAWRRSMMVGVLR
jgi:hypothetical protein